MIVFVVMGFVFASQSSADPMGEASAHVFTDVVANVTITPVASSVDCGDVQTGDFTATIPFRIDANTQKVKISAAASALFKGDDPSGNEVTPIPLNMSEGIVFDADNANPVENGDEKADYVGAMGDMFIDAFPACGTEGITYESSQNNHFSQGVTMLVTWNQDDPEKPMGEYSGKVKMVAMVMPD